MGWTTPRTWVTGEIVIASHMNTHVRDNTDELKDTVQGDGGATLELRHLTGIFANRPAAGEAGRLYVSTDLAVTFIDDGSNWSVLSWNTRYVDRLFSDFHAPGADDLSASGWFGGWRATAGGTVGTVSLKLDDHSSVELLTGVGVGSLWHYTPGGNGSGHIRTSGGSCYPLIFEAAINLPSDSVIDAHFGVVDSLHGGRPPTPNSSIMFRQQDAGNYYTVTRDNGGGETTNDSGVAPDTSNYDVLRIEVYSASLVKFYINGTKTGTDHTTGIPDTEKLHPGFSVRCNNAGLQRAINIDMIDLLYKRYLA